MPAAVLGLGREVWSRLRAWRRCHDTGPGDGVAGAECCAYQAERETGCDDRPGQDHSQSGAGSTTRWGSRVDTFQALGRLVGVAGNGSGPHDPRRARWPSDRPSNGRGPIHHCRRIHGRRRHSRRAVERLIGAAERHGQAGDGLVRRRPVGWVMG